MAIENGVQNAELGYILDPAFQIENINGKPAVGGHIEIFEAGTDNKYISYQNFDGAQNPFKIPLGADGRAVILGDPSLSYDVYAYDSYNNLMFSRLNVQCNVPGTINLSGADTRINNTDGTLDISLRTLGNNVRQYTINTHNKVLDVQSPLYFVENSETATVIGFDQSGNYVQKNYLADFVTSSISGKADTTAVNDEFANVHNDITAISSTVAALPTFSDVESGDDAVKSWVTDQDYATRDEVSAYTKRTDFDAAVESINSNKLDVSAYRAQSGDFLQSADLADYYKKTETSSKNELNAAFDNKLDKSESANYYPMTGNPSGFLTEHQSLAALMSASKLEYNGNGEISAYDGSAFAGQGGAGDPEVNELVHSNSATWNDVSAKLDTTAFSTVSGDFLTAHQDINNLMPKSESANFYPMTGNPSGFLTAHQDLSNYATTAELANKLDTTAFSDVSGTFLTAHQDISNKLDTSAFSDVSGSFLTAIPDTYLQNTDLSTSDGKITAISGIPLSAGGSVPEGVMSESGLEFNADNEISGYNGSAFAVGGLPSDVYTLSAGSGVEITDDIENKITTISVTSQAGNPDVEAYVQNTSADIDATIINVSSNSGVWGGSALPISAGTGVKVELVGDTLVFSNDETVLFETDSPSGVSAVTCSETVKNFEKIAVLPSRFATSLGGGTGPYQYYETKWLTTGADTVNTIEPMVFEYLFWKIAKYSANNDFTQFVWNGGFEVQQDTHTYSDLSTCNVGIKKIVGINRIAGGN